MDARDARLAESVLRGFLGATPLDGRGDDGASLRRAATEANRRLWELHPSSARDRRRAYDARRQQQLHSAEDANGSQSASTAGLSSLPLSRATSPGLAGAASSPSCRRSSAASTASLASTAAAPSRAGGKPGVRGPWGVAAPAAPYAAAPTRRPTARLLHRLLAASAAAEQQRHDAHFGSVCVELVPPTRHWLEEEPGAEEAGWTVDETPAVALRRKLAAAQEQSSLAAARLRAGQVVIETFEPSVLSRPAEAEANVAEDRAARRRETEARRALDVEAARSEASARSERTEAARAELAARWEREAAVAHARSQAEMGQLAERAAKEEGARLAAFAATSWEVEAAAAAARDATLRELEEYEATMLAEQRTRLDKEAALMKALEMAPTPADTDAANARAGLGPVAELSAGEAWLRHGAGFADAADDAYMRGAPPADGLATIPEEQAADEAKLRLGLALGTPDANDGAAGLTTETRAAVAGPDSLLRLLREHGSGEVGGGMALQLPEPLPRELLVLLSDLFDAFALIASRQGAATLPAPRPSATSPHLNSRYHPHYHPLPLNLTFAPTPSSLSLLPPSSPPSSLSPSTGDDTPLPPATVRHEPCRLTGGGSVPTGGIDLVAEGFGRQYLSAEVWWRLDELEGQPNVSFPVLARAVLRGMVDAFGAALGEQGGVPSPPSLPPVEQLHCVARLYAAFSLFDASGMGAVRASDLELVLGALDVHLAEGELRDLLQLLRDRLEPFGAVQAGAGGEGADALDAARLVSFTDFVALMAAEPPGGPPATPPPLPTGGRAPAVPQGLSEEEHVATGRAFAQFADGAGADSSVAAADIDLVLQVLGVPLPLRELPALLQRAGERLHLSQPRVELDEMLALYAMTKGSAAATAATAVAAAPPHEGAAEEEVHLGATLRERVGAAFALFENAEGTVRAADLELVLKQLGHHLTSAEAHAAARAIGLEAGTGATTVTLPRLLHLLTDGAAALEAGTLALGGTLAAVPPQAVSDPFSAWLYGHGELAAPGREPAVGAAWIYA